MRAGKAQLTRQYQKGLRLLSQRAEAAIHLFGKFLLTPQASDVLYDDISSLDFQIAFRLQATQIPGNQLPDCAKFRGQVLLALV